MFICLANRTQINRYPSTDSSSHGDDKFNGRPLFFIILVFRVEQETVSNCVSSIVSIWETVEQISSSYEMGMDGADGDGGGSGADDLGYLLDECSIFAFIKWQGWQKSETFVDLCADDE